MQKAPQLKNATKLALSRANLAKTAQFTVTTVMAPKSGPKDTQVFQVAVSGAKARMDYKDKALGEVRYVVNEKGTFFFIPANKAAQKLNLKIEDGLNTVFSQASPSLLCAAKEPICGTKPGSVIWTR